MKCWQTGYKEECISEDCNYKLGNIKGIPVLTCARLKTCEVTLVRGGQIATISDLEEPMSEQAKQTEQTWKCRYPEGKCLHPINCGRYKDCLAPKSHSVSSYDGLNIHQTVQVDQQVGYTRAGSSYFYKLLEQMAETHDKKSHDYASDGNPFANYHFAGMMSKVFQNPDDSGFLGRIGEKIYRLANLENDGKIPKNESIEDTEIDICTIVVLWMASRKTRRENRTREQRIKDLEKQLWNTSSKESNQFNPSEEQMRQFKEGAWTTEPSGASIRDSIESEPFRKAITGVINGHGIDSQLNTPDHTIADLIIETLRILRQVSKR